MLPKLRTRLTYANVMATVAVFIALGGSSYAALKITGRNVPRDALTGADIKKLTGRDVTNNSLTGADVKNLGSGDVANGKLLAEDFAPGQLPKGEKGDTGPPGAPTTKLHAVTDANCTSLVRGSGATGVTAVGASRCDVRFSQNVANCVPLATLSNIVADHQIYADALNDNPQLAVTGLEADEISVVTDDSAGNGSRHSFYLVVFC